MRLVDGFRYIASDLTSAVSLWPGTEVCVFTGARGVNRTGFREETEFLWL